MLALIFNVGSLFAGFIIALNVWVFGIANWVVIAYPGVMSVRGAVAGLASGHLSTGLNLGTIRPGFRGNTRDFYALIGGIMLSSLIGGIVLSLALAIVASYAGLLVAGEAVFPIMFVLSVLMLTSIITFPFSAFVGFQSFKKGLDPDYIVYPVMSSTADILVTAIYVLTLFIYNASPNTFLIYSTALLLAYIGVMFFLIRRRIHETLELLKEAILMLVIVAVIVHIAGFSLEGIYREIGSYPGVYMVYPALLSTAGDVGSILGSRATTKLALGEIKATPISMAGMLPEFLAVWLSSLTMYSTFGFLAGITMGVELLPWLLEKILIVNLLAIPMTAFMSFLIAIGAALRGWNPDSFVNPIESAMADALTALILYAVLTIV